jgi:hypothetical protein
MRTSLAVLATILMIQAGIPAAFAQGGSSQVDLQRERDQRIESLSPAGGDPVPKVLKAGLMQGFPDGQFHPESTLTRAQLATILVKAFQLDKRQPILLENTALQDVPAGYWAADAIRVVMTRGIMTGYRSCQFYPNHHVSRAEALAIFAQAYGVYQFDDATVNTILSQYPDANQIPAWARKSMATSLKAGFVEAKSGDKIRPQQPMTRGELAYALGQYLDRLHQSEQKTLH